MLFIMIVMVIGFIAALLWAVVDWGKILRGRFANNPNKGRVYIETGADISWENAKCIGTAKKGQTFQYKWGGKQKLVIIPDDYPVRWVDGRRVIAVRNGRLVASKIYGQPSKELEAEAIAAITLDNALVALINALTSKGMPKWLLIALLVGGAVLVFFVIRQLGGGGAEAPPPAPPPINPETGEPFASLLTTFWRV